jgi:Kef-type K+ transport system membrane component KefB
MSDLELSRLLLSLVLLLSCALGAGHIFNVLRLPRVIGEISAGLLLGPSCLGFFLPELHVWLFQGFSDQEKLLSVFYWLGLILLMFTAGFKIPSSLAKGDLLLVSALVLGGMSLPFAGGFLAANLLPNTETPMPLVISLVMAIASAVTSIPVITRIFLDSEMLSSRFARLTLAAAAIQDLFLWIVLSAALTIHHGEDLSSNGFGAIFLGTVFFSVFCIAVVPALLRFAGRAVMRRSPEASLLGYTLLVCLILVSLASILKVNIVFGALLAGLVIGRLPVARLENAKQIISSVAIWFFVPIYFALVGLQINLPASFDVTLVVGFLLASSLVKVSSVALFASFTKVTWGRALDFGVIMNARGGPGIVLASLAYAAKVIDEPLFVTLVMASILTSIVAGVWVRWRRASLVEG